MHLRRSSARGSKTVAEVTPCAHNVMIGNEHMVSVPLGYASPRVLFSLKFTEDEARMLASQLLTTANLIAYLKRSR